jgi:hypothetical protein
LNVFASPRFGSGGKKQGSVARYRGRRLSRMGRGLWSVKALNHLQRSRRNRSGAGGYRHQLMAGFLAAPAEGPARHAHHKIAAPTTISTVVMSTRYSTAPRARRSAFSAKSGGFRPRAWRDCYLDTSNKQTRSDTYLHVAPGRCTQSKRGRGQALFGASPCPRRTTSIPNSDFSAPPRAFTAGCVWCWLA